MNLLDRTRRLLQGFTPAPSAKTQYYHVSCPEGHHLRGERTEGYQALRCPTCGEGIFILPRSPLPEPVASATEKRPAKAAMSSPSFDEGPITLKDPPAFSSTSGELEPLAEIEWVDEAAPVPETVNGSIDEAAPAAVEEKPASTPRPKATNAPAADTPRKPATSKPAPARPAQGPRVRTPAPTIVVEESVSRSEILKDWVRKHRNPLIFAAVGLVVLSTIGYRVGRSRFQDLPRIAKIGSEQGLPALDAGRFDTAQELLSEASRAVDALGGQVDKAEEIRQGAREAAIFTNLSPDSLESILADASADPKERESRFSTIYKGRSIIIDANIVAAPTSNGSGGYELDYRVIPTAEGSKRVGRLDLSHFRLFEDSLPKVGDHVIFGARLGGLNLDPVTGEWLFNLDPESGVSIRHSKALESIGWPTDTVTREAEQ